MPKYRKKPVVVEAVQLTREVVVKSPEGEIRGNVGDWLVTGTHGEQYIVQAKIFRDIYEEAD
jgi:hypothetical protein